MKISKSTERTLSIITPIAALIFYLLVGFCTGAGWSRGWLVFLLIPIVDTTFTALQKQRPLSYVYPVTATFIFLFCGLFFEIWHPTWVLFLTIPIFYWICKTFPDKKKEEQSQIAKSDGSVYYTPDSYNTSNNYDADNSYNTPDNYDTFVEQRENENPVALKVFLGAICAVTAACVLALICVFAIPSDMRDNGNVVIKAGSTISYDNSSSYNVGAGEVNAVKYIDVDWYTGNVTIAPYDKDVISIQESKTEEERYSVRYKLVGDKLMVKYCQSGTSYADLKNVQKDLTIYIPRDLELLDVDISSVSAPIILRTVRAKQLEIETVSGDIDVEGWFEEADIESVSANAQLYSLQNNINLEMETVSGNCDVILPKDATGYNCSFESVSGKIEGYDGFKRDKNFSDKQHKYGDGAAKINFTSVSGNLKISRNY